MPYDNGNCPNCKRQRDKWRGRKVLPFTNDRKNLNTTNTTTYYG